MSDLPNRVKERLEEVKIIIGKADYTLCRRKYGASSRFVKCPEGYAVVLEKECQNDGIELLTQCVRIEKPIVEGSDIDLYLAAEEVLVARYYDTPMIRNILNKRCSE